MTKKSIASIIFVLIIAFAFIQFSEEVFEGDTLSVDTYIDACTSFKAIAALANQCDA